LANKISDLVGDFDAVSSQFKEHFLKRVEPSLNEFVFEPRQ
jgi:hypothetical protein